MAASEVLEDVAALLSGPQREKFLLMAAKFQAVPEDDEYLQLLEAIGFMTLLWKEVPQEIRKILEGANPVTETHQSLAKQVKAAVENAIPTHGDLRQVTQSLEEHQLALKQSIGAIKNTSTGSPRTWLIASVSFLMGMVVCWVGLQGANFSGADSWWEFFKSIER